MKEEIKNALKEYAAIVEEMAKEYTNETTVETVRVEHPELDFMDNEEIVELLEHAKNQRNTNLSLSRAAATLGRKGGKSKSAAKAKAAAENGKKGGRPRIYGNILGSKDVIETRGYVFTQTAAGKLVRSEPFKERVYRINGVDCIEMDSQSTASGSALYFFALEEIERNQNGWYIKPTRQPRYLWLSWHKNKPEIPMRGISVGENEKPYQK